MPASHYSRPGINTDPGRRWQTVDCTWTLSLGHFLNLKKKLQIQIQMCVEVEVVTFMS